MVGMIRETQREHLYKMQAGGISKGGNIPPPEDAGVLYKRTFCPLCRKRVFDIYASPLSYVIIRQKCQHCRNIVIF
jgi:hypothetical protein